MRHAPLVVRADRTEVEPAFARAKQRRVRRQEDLAQAVRVRVVQPPRHAVPEAAQVLGIAAAILTESGLSFLGIGVPADLVTWGSLLNEARSNSFAWWLAVFPGAAIFLAVMFRVLAGVSWGFAVSTALAGAVGLWLVFDRLLGLGLQAGIMPFE